jgi:transcriptional regulator with XRE-family HTH domain
MGERLQIARTERSFSKATLASAANLNPGSILGIERGGQAGVDTVEALAKALQVSPAWLAFGIGPQELAPRRRTASTPEPR